MLLLECYPMQSQGGEGVEGGVEIQGDEVQGCHNARTCPKKSMDGGFDSQHAPSSKAKKRKIRGSSSQLVPSTREDADMG
ncbi:hypothetical protein LIER_13367 [Lithospermum erythrorhizon]|uniref:Uncharacterized protein n=1 Tax=Lithospermum erythrorhizon TaxID=34254 RepID=A0AAV3PW10_LITER